MNNYKNNKKQKIKQQKNNIILNEFQNKIKLLKV